MNQHIRRRLLGFPRSSAFLATSLVSLLAAAPRTFAAAAGPNG